MAKVKLDTQMPVAADALWRSIGSFAGLGTWHPAIAESTTDGSGTGSTRTLNLVGGGSIVERLEGEDAADRTYRYSILSGPLPVADYVSELHVKDNGDGTSTVEWSSEFQPKGAPEPDAVAVIQGIYQAGFDNLKKMFGA